MRKLSITTALISALSVSTVHAEDIISRFSVLDQGRFAVDGDLSTQKNTGSQIDRTGLTVNGQPKFSGTSRIYSSAASVDANVGLGYGLELFASLPYVLRNYSETKYNNGQNFIFNSDGFTDATFGVKYRLFKSADATDEVLFRGSFLHHSGSRGNMLGELDFLHTFSQTIKIALSAHYTKVQSGPDSTGYGAYLMWQTSPQITLVPFIAAGKTNAYQHLSSYNSYEGGLELRYSPSSNWNITPRLTLNHVDQRDTNYYVDNLGSQRIIAGSITIQKIF
ncbi:hypothetical protein [Collimonas humicola]|uniref:hypothetical protein n=1 Tax=Collimonas humicola TaxID=2825886 RepID=UPI001B8BF66C|nr:hypothetical protein [Collimonas humicola]